MFCRRNGHRRNTTIVDPDVSSPAAAALGRNEPRLRTCLKRYRLSVPEERLTRAIRTLVQESAETWAAQGKALDNWTFFHVTVEKELYAPVRELSRLETVFPARFETLDELAAGVPARAGERFADLLYERYLRLGAPALRARCNYYVTTHSTPGSWIEHCPTTRSTGGSWPAPARSGAHLRRDRQAVAP